MKKLFIVVIGAVFAGTLFAGSVSARPARDWEMRDSFYGMNGRNQPTRQCLQVLVYGKDSRGNCRLFGNTSCTVLPAGWTRVSSCTTNAVR